MSNTAVLVNEFGEVGLDHHLLRRVDERAVLLGGGCVCCTTREDLVELLRVPAAKIDVVTQAAAAPSGQATCEPELRARLALGERRLLLSASAKRRHKNAARVLEAMVGMEPAPVLVVTGYASPHEHDLRVPEHGREPGAHLLDAVVPEDQVGREERAGQPCERNGASR